jgi:hypothetical protein
MLEIRLTDENGKFITSFAVTHIGYGRQEFKVELLETIKNFNPNEPNDLFRFLAGKISKRTTGQLIYYISKYNNVKLTLYGW